MNGVVSVKSKDTEDFEVCGSYEVKEDANLKIVLLILLLLLLILIQLCKMILIKKYQFRKLINNLPAN